MKQNAPVVPTVVWVTFLATSLVLVVFPSIDLGVSALFYTPGEGFTVDGVWYERIFYESVDYAMILVNGGLVAVWIYGRCARGGVRRISGKALGFLLLLLALGPGLVVNVAMKEHLSRARPEDLIEFGGTKHFSPAFIASDQAGRSFPSGHAAAAFYLVAVAFVVARRKRLWMRILLGYGFLVGAFRIASGGHFFSDVLVSFFIVLLLFFLLYRIIFGRAPSLA
jgi:lipid A 4'-phosphatase